MYIYIQYIQISDIWHRTGTLFIYTGIFRIFENRPLFVHVNTYRCTS